MASELAGTALQINSDIPETYWVLAYIHAERRQHEQALRHLETAVRLYPSFADGYALMGAVNTHIGRPVDSIPLVRTAMRLNPEGSRLYFLTLGRAYLFLGDLEQAQAVAKLVQAEMPHLSFETTLTSLHGDVRKLLPLLDI